MSTYGKPPWNKPGAPPGGLPPYRPTPGGPAQGGPVPGFPTPGGPVPGGPVPGFPIPGVPMPGVPAPGQTPPGGPPRDVTPGLFGSPRPNERPFGPLEELEMAVPPGVPPATPPVAPPFGGADLTSLARRIENYLQDEVTANRFYQELAAQSQNETVKRYLLEAARDEQKHFQLLSQLYQRITGRPAPRPQPQEQSFPTLRDALLKAIDNEFEAYEEYKTEYQRFADPQIRWIFFELFSDEIEHAVRFNTALHIMAGMA